MSLKRVSFSTSKRSVSFYPSKRNNFSSVSRDRLKISLPKRSFTIRSAVWDAKDGAPKFSWKDPLQFSSQLTEDEVMIRDQVSQYCQQKLLPRVLEANRHEHFDTKIMTEMGELGMLGSTIKGPCCLV